MITIYTDGACRGNQNTTSPGGWGYAITDEDTGKQRHCWGHDPDTTNNRMELTAAIRALSAIRRRPCSEVTIYSDSSLLVKGMNEWLDGWKARGWRTGKRKPVANRGLWERLDELSACHSVTWVHVRGHAGHPGNELADELANRGADGLAGCQDVT